MKTNKEKLNKHGWKSRFVRLTSLMMLCFNVLSAPLTAIGMVAIAGVSVTLVVSCDKDKDGQNQEQPQQQKHNVELVYGRNNETQWQNISMDTLYKYNSDQTVDTVFMVPEVYNQFSTLQTSQLKNYLIPLLRERHNVNPNKVFGKGELQLWNQSVMNNPEIVRFFADTLKYNVTFYNTAKSK